MPLLRRGTRNLLRAWGTILTGHAPTLSIEITKECPLRCPGCYAYEPAHLGSDTTLRSLTDLRGDDLVARILDLVRERRPAYLSIVGGEPLVRFRELEVLLPRLGEMGLPVQLVTSAVRPIPRSWSDIPGLYVCVSIDGLQPDHDARRAPATYERILKHIEGGSITVHCTVTRSLADRGKLEEFVRFWSARREVTRIWFSLFTPQVGAGDPEILSPPERERVLDAIALLRTAHAKVQMPDPVLRGLRRPPGSPAECLFARTTDCLSADLHTPVTPCQLGGEPDCSQCGCMASAGLHAVGGLRVAGLVPLRALFDVSERLGAVVRSTRRRRDVPSPSVSDRTSAAPALVPSEKETPT
ncbi:MAG: radical SAM protein [Acidobacteriota bacterium]|jgi:MoaA/NifB/PqqE/SkfB family radical SAM enzyme